MGGLLWVKIQRQILQDSYGKSQKRDEGAENDRIELILYILLCMLLLIVGDCFLFIA